jgi:hypothetical protein
MATNTTSERALALLGAGHAPEMVASAIGVTPARISQLLSQDEFAQAVALRRYESLTKTSQRLEAYERVEDKILDRLEKNLSMIFDPMKLASILSKISSAKPRSLAIEGTNLGVGRAETVTLNIPTLVLNKFQVTMNVNNQVIATTGEEGEVKSLVTMASASLDKFVNSSPHGKLNHEQPLTSFVERIN